MKTRITAIAAVVSVAFLAGSAQASVIAGWDFSQYKVPGSSVGGGSPLSANYAWGDPNGAGAEAASYGTATFSSLLPTAGGGLDCERTGGNSSTVDENVVGCAPPNTEGPIRSNRYESFDLGKPSFGAHSLLKTEGQTYAHHYAVFAESNTDLVLEVDQPGGAQNWAVSFGGRTFSGTSTVTVEFSTDGSSYSSYPSAALTTDDTRFRIDLDTVTTAKAYVRLGLSTGSGTPIIDNVAVEAIPLPEPGLMLQLMAGLMGLGVLKRLRP